MTNLTIHNKRTSKTDGTCLQGYFNTTYTDLVNRLGPCNEGSADGKTTAEWVLESGDGTIATIYDWKTGTTPKEDYNWHIGGKSTKALDLVQKTLGIETRKY
jgi:hypothetical protein